MMAVSAMLFTACSTNNDDVSPVPVPPPAPETPKSVKFHPSLTRATETAFEYCDKISVFAVHPSAGTALKTSGNYADNVCYTYQGNVFSAEKGISLPSDSAGLAYFAVYPYQGDASNQGIFQVQKNQLNHASITSSDLCTAYAAVSNNQDVWLNFNHRLSRICVDISGENIATKKVSMRLNNVCYEVSYDLNANTFIATGNRSDILMGETSTNRFEAILLPQTFLANTTFLIITIDGKEFPMHFAEETTFRSGKEYDYSLTYTEDKIVVVAGDINPWNTNDERLNNVVPEEIQEKMSNYMPIYQGVNPPNVEGTYYIDPFETVFCEDYDASSSTKYYPGYIVSSCYCQFLNQNNVNNTIDFRDVSETGNSTDVGSGAFISGSGNNFTAFFNTYGESNGIKTRTALVVSGTKTSEGIANLYYAFIMVEKGDDPDHKLMDEGIFRVFRDQDGISVNTTWPEASRPASKGWKAPWASTVSSEK